MHNHNVGKIWVQTASSKYPVTIGENIFHHIPGMLKNSPNLKKVLIIYDKNTKRLFGRKISDILLKKDITVYEYVIEPGETSKSIRTYGKIIEYAAESELTRSDAMIALGGGIVGDITGFAAGTYMRGIDFYQIPTTLLAAIDSSVGGKTGLNLKNGKNLAGVFWQPKGILCDMNNLKTLDKAKINDGMAEIIKTSMICDRELFDIIDQRTLSANLHYIIRRCIELKAMIVSQDELDKGKRQLLNFGHTIAHAIEKLSHYEITHGHAVAMGMAMITRSAQAAGLCLENVTVELISKLKSFGLPVDTPFSSKDIYDVTLRDKKRSGDKINIIIPKAIGKCIIYPLNTDEFLGFIKKGEAK